MPSKQTENTVKSTDTKPTIKKVNEKLSISITFLETTQSVDEKQTIHECLIGFHNVLNSKIIINPEVSRDSGADNGSTWLNSIFGSSKPSESATLIDEPVDQDIKIFLGYIQLLGYVVLNYNFQLQSATNPMEISSKNVHWWNNKDYIHQYENDDDMADEDEELRESCLARVPFIRENSTRPLIVGGKLGGVNDLVVENEKSSGEHGIDERNRYLVNDLLFNFNSYATPSLATTKSKEFEESKLPIKELTDSIIPFYSTSQHLLFTDLSIPALSTRTFHLRFPQNKDLPPSYNTRLTGVVADQGLVSTKYSLIVGLLEDIDKKLVPHSIYFPLNIKGERVGNNDRWLQRNYFKESSIMDKSWTVDTVEDDEEPLTIEPAEPMETREEFLQDLSKLIETDLYNMPKMSTHERRKSIPNLNSLSVDESSNNDLIPQLPLHLKTQFQIRVNNNQLCMISLSKPYYHIGEDISFIIDINPENHSKSTKAIGIISHLEAHEIFHYPGNKTDAEGSPVVKTYERPYRVSGSIKFNTYSTSILNSYVLQDTNSLVNGSINVPNYLTQLFQSSKFMDLKYYLVFKFILSEIKPESGNTSEQLAEETTNESEPEHEDSAQNTELLTETTTLDFFEDIKEHRSENYATELRFRLPLVLLP
jgi:Rgp1.